MWPQRPLPHARMTWKNLLLNMTGRLIVLAPLDRSEAALPPQQLQPTSREPLPDCVKEVQRLQAGALLKLALLVDLGGACVLISRQAQFQTARGASEVRCEGVLAVEGLTAGRRRVSSSM